MFGRVVLRASECNKIKHHQVQESDLSEPGVQRVK
jgi:hypothetical protein